MLHQPLTVIPIEKYHDTAPICIALLRKNWPVCWLKDVYTPPICTTFTFQTLKMWKSAARRLRQMGGILPGVSTLMTAFDKIIVAFNLNNPRGKWFYQTERNKIPMVDVSPAQAAHFLHTVEVNLKQTTTMVGYCQPPLRYMLSMLS